MKDFGGHKKAYTEKTTLMAKNSQRKIKGTKKVKIYADSPSKQHNRKDKNKKIYPPKGYYEIFLALLFVNVLQNSPETAEAIGTILDAVKNLLI